MGVYGSPNLNQNNQVLEKGLYCRKCGRLMPEKQRKCPDCNYENIKPFYKKLSFYIIIILIFSFLNDESPSSTYSETYSSNVNESAVSKEEFIASCNSYTYEELARNPQKYVGEHVTLKGKVIQTMESGKNVKLRINVTQNEYYWDDTIYCTYKYGNDESRILEDDIITIYGTSKGVTTYTTVLNSSVTIPHIEIMFLER